MKVAFDIELMRPGCALVAAALGADAEACVHFDTDKWLLAPTPGIRVYETTMDQLTKLATRVNSL